MSLTLEDRANQVRLKYIMQLVRQQATVKEVLQRLPASVSRASIYNAMAEEPKYGLSSNVVQDIVDCLGLPYRTVPPHGEEINAEGHEYFSVVSEQCERIVVEAEKLGLNVEFKITKKVRDEIGDDVARLSAAIKAREDNFAA